MKHTSVWMTMVSVSMALLLMACGASKEQKKNADQLMETARHQKDYEGLLRLADSLATDGSLSAGKADYWRGYAYDRMKQTDKAIAHWRAAVDETSGSKRQDDTDIYAKAASRLANLLCLKADFQGAVDVAQPAVARLEELACDTTSDYVNLLIYIGCCQTNVGSNQQAAEDYFDRAFKKHTAYMATHHSDEAYKNAIAGLINIAYFTVRAGNYQAAVDWTKQFGELIGEYEQRPGVSADYVDRQVGRYDIYMAYALSQLGRTEESEAVYKAYLATKYSQTDEARKVAEKLGY